MTIRARGLSCPSRPEKHILLFRRKLGTDGTTGLVNDAAAQKAREQYRREFEGDFLA